MSHPQTYRFVLFWLIHTTHTTRSQLNQYVESNPSPGEYVWQSTSDFIPVQSQSYGEIMIGHEMSVEFDFVWGGRTNDPQPGLFEMFFRVGYDSALGNSCSGQGSRYPSFWISSSEDTMHVSTSNSSMCQPRQSLSDYGVISKHVSYHVLIAFNMTLLSVHISGGDRAHFAKHWSREGGTRDSHIGTMAQIWWMSSKYGQTQYNRGNGTFSNVVITSKVYTPSPTADPTSPPTTTSPSPSPSRPPSLQPLPSAAPTSEVAPTHDPTSESSPVDDQSATVSLDDPVVEEPDANDLHHRVETVFFSGDMLYITSAAIACMAMCCCLILVFCIKLKQQEMVKKRTQREVMSRSSSPYSVNSRSVHSHMVQVYSDRYRSYSGHYPSYTNTQNTHNVRSGGSAQYGSNQYGSNQYGSAHYGSSQYYGPSSAPSHYGRPRYFSNEQQGVMPIGNPRAVSRPSSETSVRFSSQKDQAMDGTVYDFNPKPKPLSPPPIMTSFENQYYSKAQKREVLKETPRLPAPPNRSSHQNSKGMSSDGSTSVSEEDDAGHLPPGSPRVDSRNSDELVMGDIDGHTAMGHLEVPEEQSKLMMHQEDGSRSNGSRSMTPM